MAVNFPDSPSNGDTYVVGGVTYTYNSTKNAWETIGGAITTTGSGDTPPANPADGDLWFNSSSAELSVRYNDGTSSQWVAVSGAAGPPGTDGSSPNLSAVAEDILPDADSSRSLGSASKKWKDLFLSGDTISLGSIKLKDAGGSLKVETSAGADVSPGGIKVYANLAAFPDSGNTVGDMGFATDTKAVYIWNGTEWDRIYTGAQEMVEWTTTANSSYNMLIGDASTTISVSATDPDGFGITYGYLTNPSNPSSATVVQGTGANTNDFVITPDASTTGNFSLRITANDGVSKVSTVSAIAVNQAGLLTGLTGGTGGESGATTYTAPDGMVVTAQYGVYPASPNYYMSNLFNGNHSTGTPTDYWLSSSGSTGYLEFDLSNHTVSSANISYIQKVIIYPWCRDDTFTNITSIEWSNDNGTTWTQSHGDQGWTSSVAVGYNETFLIEQDATHFRLGMQRIGNWGYSLHEVQIYAG